jgi:hypothetical protein
MQFYELSDVVFGPFVLLCLLLFGKHYVNKKLENDPNSIYRYFYKGLTVKLIGGLSLCLVYTFYYPGGDTIQYFNDAKCFVRLLFDSPGSFLKIFFHKYDRNDLSYFNQNTGYPVYIRDSETWFAVKFFSIFVLLSFQSYLVSTFLISTLSFIGIWKLYKVFIMEFPELKKEMAIAQLFIPSVFFWGSGILKDTITFSCVGYFVSSFYMLFIRKEKLSNNLLQFLISGVLIISIKPYIFIGLLPGLVFWVMHLTISKIKGEMARLATFPLLLGLSIIFGYILLNMLGTQLAEYQLETILDKALVMQQDLKMDYYRGNSFDIGDFDATIPSMLSKAPSAIFAALFRPFIFEANNVVMLLSSIENLIILIFFIKVLFQTGVLNFFRLCFSNHLLIFCFIFTLFFAFAIGLSTSNFGSLVRYKLPCVPFFVSTIFIVKHLYNKGKIKNAIN